MLASQLAKPRLQVSEQTLAEHDERALAGVVGQQYTSSDGVTHAWQNIWLIPAVMSAILIVVFAILFKEDHNQEKGDTDVATN